MQVVFFSLFKYIKTNNFISISAITISIYNNKLLFSSEIVTIQQLLKNIDPYIIILKK